MSSGPNADKALRVIDLDTFTESQVIANPGWGTGIPTSGDFFDVGKQANDYFVACRQDGYNVIHLYNFTTSATVGTRDRADGLVPQGVRVLDARDVAATSPYVAIAYLNTATTSDTVTLEIYDIEGATLVGEVSFTPTEIFNPVDLNMSVSPDGMYLFCLGSIVDISEYSAPEVVSSIPAFNAVYSWCHG